MASCSIACCFDSWPVVIRTCCFVASCNKACGVVIEVVIEVVIKLIAL